jgi:hypothetical protein
MKKLTFLFGLLFCWMQIFAQHQPDRVYLHSGSVVSGSLVSMNSKFVKIRSGNALLVYNLSLVDSISKAKRIRSQEQLLADKKYFFTTEAGVLAGNSNNEHSAPFSFMSAFNYNIYSGFSAGAGIGIEFYDESYVPVFGQLKYRFRHTDFSPMVSCQAGYLLPVEETNKQSYTYYDYRPWSSSIYYPPNSSKLDADGGFFINPAVGFEHRIHSGLGWYAAFGYRFHTLNYSGTNSYKLEEEYNRFSLKVGIIFN